MSRPPYSLKLSREEARAVWRFGSSDGAWDDHLLEHKRMCIIFHLGIQGSF